MRSPFTIVINNVVAIAALFLAAVYWGSVGYAVPQPEQAFTGCPAPIAEPCQNCLAAAQDQVLNRSVMTIISLSLVGVATFLQVFAAERVVYWREAASLPQPRQTIAYALGKDIAMLPQLIVGLPSFPRPSSRARSQP
jgi:hypothetical protein